MRHGQSWSLALGLAAALASAPPVPAQNLAFNGEFDLDVAGWYMVAGVLDWSPDDHELCPESGSAAVLNNIAGTADVYLQRCVGTVVGGATYSLGVDLRLPGADWTVALADLEVRFYEDANCAGSNIELLYTPAVYADPAAPWVRSERLSVVAPATAEAVHFAVLIRKSIPGDYTAGVDGIFLVRGAGLLFRDGFESTSTCRWSTTTG